ncbi:PTS glucitol/sorbitol transporter subunit IIA [Brooklawnia sp.]|uniref:PTS glucitol/sorbitol transporter subunit IIA n=1 Tax=Brooklawnia sp. TaxID=2699740 RepID=UPI00311F3EC3
MTSIFSTTVEAIGGEADAFAAQGMYILFGAGAPPELADFCYTIRLVPTSAAIAVGQKFVIDGVEFPITAVGSVVRKNLDGLGHITINFNGASEASLDGSLHVSGDAPPLNVGSTISIEE